MDLVIKLNSEVAGKDKLARLLQYGCRALWDSLDGTNDGHLALIHQLKSLEYILSSFRKLLRFGKSLEVFYASFRTIHLNDAWLAFTLTVNKICQSIFLLTDHVVWLSRSGLVKDVDAAKWTQRSNKYWVISLVMGIVRDVYEINRVISSSTSYKNLSQCIASSALSIRSAKDITVCLSSLCDFVITYKHLSVDTVKNCCDLFIPLTSMGYTKLSPRIIGLLGVVSSIAGLIVVLNPKCKLSPS